MNFAVPRREKWGILTPSMCEIRASSECKVQRHGDLHSVYLQLHTEILDNILTQLKNRFPDNKKLLFLSLLGPKKFSIYRGYFSDSEFESLEGNHELNFSLPKLKTDLTVMYNMSNFEGKEPSGAALVP